jgi:hypothetical protein
LFAVFIGYLIDSAADLSRTWTKLLVAFLFLIAVIVGLRWNPRRWIISATVFYGIFFLVWSVCFTHMEGVATGLWGDAAYWIGQHTVARGGQPNFYYLMLIPIYEFLPVILASVAVVWAIATKNLGTILLIIGTIASVILYAFAASFGSDERRVIDIIIYIIAGCLILRALIPLLMSLYRREPANRLLRIVQKNILITNREGLYPKSLLFIAGALILLYGLKLGHDSEPGKLTSNLLTLCAVCFMVLYVQFSKAKLFNRFLIYWAAMSLVMFSFFGERMPWVSLNIVLPAIVFGGAFIGHITKGLNKESLKKRFPMGEPTSAIRWVYFVGTLVIISVLLFLTGYTAFIACRESYQVEDKPPQMLFYAGMSADVPRIAAKIHDVAQETGAGFNLSITFDNDIVGWLDQGTVGRLMPAYDSGWYWYLRDYTNVDRQDCSSLNSAPNGSVLILEAGHVPADSQYLEKYGEGERFKYLIWPPEDYKSGISLKWWWNYFLNREASDYLMREAIIYFPKGY